MDAMFFGLIVLDLFFLKVIFYMVNHSFSAPFGSQDFSFRIEVDSRKSKEAWLGIFQSYVYVGAFLGL